MRISFDRVPTAPSPSHSSQPRTPSCSALRCSRYCQTPRTVAIFPFAGVQVEVTPLHRAADGLSPRSAASPRAQRKSEAYRMHTQRLGLPSDFLPVQRSASLKDLIFGKLDARPKNLKRPDAANRSRHTKVSSAKTSRVSSAIPEDIASVLAKRSPACKSFGWTTSRMFESQPFLRRSPAPRLSNPLLCPRKAGGHRVRPFTAGKGETKRNSCVEPCLTVRPLSPPHSEPMGGSQEQAGWDTAMMYTKKTMNRKRLEKQKTWGEGLEVRPAVVHRGAGGATGKGRRVVLTKLRLRIPTPVVGARAETGGGREDEGADFCAKVA